MIRLVSYLLPLMMHLDQGCKVGLTRRELERRLGSWRSQRGGRTQGHNSAISGNPGEDYPVLTKVPDETSFSCDGRTDGGFYGDPSPESRCQVFHRCVDQGNSSGIKLAKSKLGTFLIKLNRYSILEIFLQTLVFVAFCKSAWSDKVLISLPHRNHLPAAKGGLRLVVQRQLLQH